MGDDSEILIREVVHHVVTKRTLQNRKIRVKGAVGLVSSGEAEDADAEVEETDDTPAAADAKTEVWGKRTRRPNLLHTNFWRHANDKDEDLEVPVAACVVRTFFPVKPFCDFFEVFVDGPGDP